MKLTSTILLTTLGLTLTAQATPLILLILPWSWTWTGLNDFLTGHLNTTRPPPPGGDPLFLTLSSRPVSSRRNLLRTGRQEDLIMSGDGSRWWLVTPVSARCRGSLQNGARVRIGSSQYPTPLVREHWCSILPKLLICFYFSKLKWNLYLLIKIQAGSSEMFQFHWLQSWIH